MQKVNTADKLKPNNHNNASKWNLKKIDVHFSFEWNGRQLSFMDNHNENRNRLKMLSCDRI